MQTTETETNNPLKAALPSLDAQIDAARAVLAKLQEAADDAETEAQRWRTAFEHEPTTETHQNAAIWAQKATNARSAVEQHEQGVIWKLEADRKAAQFSAANAAYEAQEKRIDAAMTRAVDAVVAAAKQLDDAIAEFEALGNLNQANRALGLHPVPFRFAVAIDQANTKLRNRLPIDARYPHTTHVSLYPQLSQSDGFVVLQLNRPIAKVPGVFR